MSVYEEQAKLMRFDEPTGLSGVIPKYVSLLIQIGYIVLFAPAYWHLSGACGRSARSPASYRSVRAQPSKAAR